jgi:hypothetical protein
MDEINYMNADYTENDCSKVTAIYLEKRKSRSSCLVENHTKNFLYDLRFSLAQYKITKSDSSAITKKQLKGKHLKVRKNALELFQCLKNESDTNFLNSMISARLDGKAPHLIEDNLFNQTLQENFRKFEILEESLKWLIDNLDRCLSDDFNYPYLKSSEKRKLPETEFIQNLSSVLTKYFESGGYTRSDYQAPPTGWRIDCLEYLLKHAGVSRERNQIVDSIG